jgi:hypothetical protein
MSFKKLYLVTETKYKTLAEKTINVSERKKLKNIRGKKLYEFLKRFPSSISWIDNSLIIDDERVIGGNINDLINRVTVKPSKTLPSPPGLSSFLILLKEIDAPNNLLSKANSLLSKAKKKKKKKVTAKTSFVTIV